MRSLMYFLVFLALAGAIVGYAAYVYKNGSSSGNERFSDRAVPAAGAGDDDVAAAAAAGSPSYDSRLYVLQTFDTLLRRKPTDAELDKYSRLGSNSAILAAITRDHKSDHGDDKKKGDGDSSSDDSDEEEDDGEFRGRGRGGGRGRGNDRDVAPYSPHHIHRASEASPDLGWASRPDEEDTDSDGGGDKSRRHSRSDRRRTKGVQDDKNKGDDHADHRKKDGADHGDHGDHRRKDGGADHGDHGDHADHRKKDGDHADHRKKDGADHGDHRKKDGEHAEHRKKDGADHPTPHEGDGHDGHNKNDDKKHATANHVRVRRPYAGDDDARVCIDRADLRIRLQGIADQVEQFKRFLDLI